MRKKVICLLISYALLMTTPVAPFAQTVASNASKAPSVEPSAYLVDIAGNAPALDGAYQSATKKIAAILGRDSRKWNTCVLASSQNPSDVLGMDVANFMSAAFVGRLEDDEAAQDGLRMLRVPTGVGYERALGTLSSGRGNTAMREFVMRDVDGHVDKVCIDLTANPALLEALNTTAGRELATVGEGQVA